MSSPTNPAAIDTGATVPEIDRLRLHNLVLTLKLDEARLEIMILKYLQTDAANSIQTRIGQVRQQIETLTQQLYLQCDKSPSHYNLEVEKGRFVKK